MNEVMKLLTNHTSIRKFSPQQVEEGTLHQLIQCGQHASSSSFLQAYSVIAVRDKEKRQKLARWCGDQEHIMQAPVFLVFCGDMQRLEKACEVQGVSMAQGMTEQLIIASVDTAIMAQNVMVAAESLGMGGVYVGAIRNQPEKVTEMLQLPKQVIPLFGMSLGYPDHSTQVKPRLPLPLVLMEETYRVDTQLMRDYDETFRIYLKNRGSNVREDTWSGTMAAKVRNEMRPHMKSYLKDQGFGLK